MSDRLGVMNAGRIEQVGTPAEVYEQPATGFVAGFVGVSNVLSGEPDDGADRTQLATPLREAGFNVAIDYSKRSVDKQLESALKHGAKVAVIRGTEESRGGKVIVRDLTAKEQRVTRLAAVVVEVGRHVPKRAKPRLVEEPAPPGGAPVRADPRD